MTGSTVLTPRQIEIIEKVKEAAKEVGHTPTLVMLDSNPDWPSIGAIRYNFRNYTELLELANLPKPKCTNRWSTKRIMVLLSSYILEIGRIPTQFEVRHNPNLPSDQVYLNIYPDWESVISSLGYPMSWCSTWMRKKLTDDLWHKYVELGYRLPNPQDVQTDPQMEKLHVYVRVFGDLKCAWRAAGIWDDYRKKNGVDIAKQILNLYEETGKVPKLRDPGMPNEHLILKVFGCSYPELLLCLGLKPTYQQYTKEQLIRQLQRKYQELGRSPTVQEITEDYNMASIQTFRRFFKTHAKALKAAKLPPAPIGKGHFYTETELIKQLQNKYQELGKTPSRREVNLDPMMASEGVFVRRFGSFKNALVAAGLPMRPAPTKYTEEELIAQLRLKADELGRAPMQKEVDADPKMASVNSFVCRFGGFNAAIIAAGLEINKSASRRKKD